MRIRFENIRYSVSFVSLLIIYGSLNGLINGSDEIVNTFTVIKAAQERERERVCACVCSGVCVYVCV